MIIIKINKLYNNIDCECLYFIYEDVMLIKVLGKVVFDEYVVLWFWCLVVY